MTSSPRLGITDLAAAQANAEAFVNEATRILEQFANTPHFKSRSTTAEPGSPADGDQYLLPGSPTGSHWSGQGNKVASYINGAWAFRSAKEGWSAWVDDEDVVISYDGSSWSITSITSEAIDDRVAALLAAGSGILLSYNDAGNQLTISATIDTLHELTDVDDSGKANGEVLTYDDASGKWVSAPAPGSGGGAGGTVPSGGSAGQTLTKLTGVDGDFGWAGGAFHTYQERPSLTNGGSSVAAWTPRLLNTIKLNTITSAAAVSSTVTISIASPGVVTWNSHGLAAGEPVEFTTTGALPTGLSIYTTYYVINPTTNTFQVAATPGGAAINTSGSQSGTHTAYTSLITLPAGTYDIQARAPCYNGAASTGFKARLYNVTGSASLIDGTTIWGSVNCETECRVQGRFSLGATSNVRVEMIATAARTSGFGVDAGVPSVNNHFTDVIIRKIV
jgi:hypothetical protein